VKVLHLNTYAGNGGAGKACLRLDKALRDNGVESEVAVNFLFRDNPHVRNLSKGFFLKWITAAEIILERLATKFYSKNVPIPFSIPLFGKNIARNDMLKSADIIHLHWINHAFLRPSDLAKLSDLDKPIVWTFHDSNAFTGGCHVRYSCDHYRNECGNCPVLKKSDSNDLSHKIWKKKRKAYQDLNFSIVSPSKWLAESIAMSKLLGSRPVINLPNTLDTNVFRPILRSEARKRLGIDPGKFILMSGFMPSRKDLHKGTSYLIEAIEIFIKSHEADKHNIELVIFGNRDDKNIPEFPVRTTFLGTISSEQELAGCYNSANVFLAPSLEDNLPYTVMESLACGTPVVAFTTGGIPDMVKHRDNGYLAEYRSAADLAEGIEWVFSHPEAEVLGLNARQYIEENFSENTIAERHIELYESLLRP
jgi:glycosyltransferase involved in cell wall biosynthesis